MGLDGGTKISRSDVLRGQSWRMAQADGTRSTRGGAVSTSTVYQDAQLSQEQQRQLSWTTCSISERPLQPPIVADRLGRLYNKEALVELLLARRGAASTDAAVVLRLTNMLRSEGAAAEIAHLRSLRDVFELHLQSNLDAAAAAAGGSSSGEGGGAAVPYACPVTLLPAGGKHPFSALQGCGHVFAARALANLALDAKTGAGGSAKAAASAAAGATAAASAAAAAAAAAESSGTSCCPTCSAPFYQEDIIPIGGSEEQVAQLQQRLAVEQQRQQQRDGKAHKSRKRAPRLLQQQDGSDVQQEVRRRRVQQDQSLLLLEGVK